MSLEVLPLPILIFSMGGVIISFVVGMWMGLVFLKCILQGMWEGFKERRKAE